MTNSCCKIRFIATLALCLAISQPPINCIGYLGSRIIARMLVQSKVLLHPCTHLALTFGGWALIEGGGNSKFWRNWHKSFGASVSKSDVKTASLGAINGLLVSATVGLYWHLSPVSPTSGRIVKLLSQGMYYGIAPAAAIVNGYFNPLCGNVIPSFIGNNDKWNANTAGNFSIGMLGTTAVLAGMVYGHRAPCAWIIGAAALGSTLLKLDSFQKDG